MLPTDSETRDKFQDTESFSKASPRRFVSSWIGRLAFYLLCIAAVSGLKHYVFRSSMQAGIRARVEAFQEQANLLEGSKQAVEERRRVIDFYNENDFKRGDFPQ